MLRNKGEKKIKENLLVSVVMQVGTEPTLMSSIFPLNVDILSVSSFISSMSLSPFGLLSQKCHRPWLKQQTCKSHSFGDPFTGEDTLPISQAESSQSGLTGWNGQGSSRGPLF